MNRSSSEFTAVPCRSAAIRRCFFRLYFRHCFWTIVFLFWVGVSGVVGLQAMSHSLDELGVDNAEVMNARSSFISWHMDNGLAHFFSIMGLILNSFFSQRGGWMYFVVSAGAPESIWSEWIAERKIVLDEWRDCKPTTCLFPPQAALEMGSFHPGWERVEGGGSQNGGPWESKGVPRRAEMGPIHRCFHLICFTFRSLTDLKKSELTKKKPRLVGFQTKRIRM